MAKLKLLFFALAFSCSSVFAAYQSVRPPPGWQPGNPTAYKPAAGEFFDLDKQKWMTLGKANVAGREISVPVALPIAPTLTVGLAVASAFSTNPAILVASVAWQLYQSYLAGQQITPHTDGTFTKVVDGLVCTSGCYEWQIDGSIGSNSYSTPWIKSRTGVALDWQNWANTINDGMYYLHCAISTAGPGGTVSCDRFYDSDGTFAGTRVINDVNYRSIPPYNLSTTKVITPSEVATAMQPYINPKPLVDALPYPVPVASPVINPDSSGLARALRVPLGDPQAVPLPSPNPDNLPQTWKTPVVDLVPSPTATDPWRVDAQTKDIISTTSTPLPETAPVPTSPASGTTTTPTNEPTITCGLPTTPPCKIDETGTPEKVIESVYGPKADAVKTSKDAGLNQMKTGGGSLFGSWNLFFSAPAFVACSPVVLPAFRGVSMGSIDPCPVVDGMRTVMGYLWAIAGLMLCLGMVRKAVQ